MAAAVVENKYYLKTLHEEIGLFDRKLAHLLKHGVYSSEEERDAAARKLSRKRESMAETARRLAAEGIEYKTSELPRSFRETDEDMIDAPAEVSPSPQEAGPEEKSRRTSGSVGLRPDLEAKIREYLDSKAA